MEEKVYYQDAKVLVTNSRFVTNDKTYAMRNISSVQLGKIAANNTAAILILIGCIITVLVADGTGTKIGAGLIGALMIFGMKKAKDKYTVRINSNSGEVDGLVSTNKEYVEMIVHEINNAIIGS